MCKPTFFDVIHKNLNAHMTMKRVVDKQRANMQYWNLTRILTNIGAEIKFINSEPKLVDMVFAANGALIDKVSNTAAISNFHAKPRVDESDFWKDFLIKHGLYVKKIYSHFEGQGDALFSHNNKNLWMGYGFRTSYNAAEELRNIFHNSNVQTLKLINPKFYHLDTCFCILNNSNVMFYPGAFDDDSVSKIKQHFPDHIEVSLEDSEKFSCNAVIIDQYIILNKASNNLKTKLQNIGYMVIEINMSEFILSGGSVKCCVLHA